MAEGRRAGPDPPDDAALVLAARAGDGDAFTTLFQRWSDRCYDVARRILHDDGAAAEVAQDTFLVVWQQLDTLRDPAAFGGWVLRAARNRALNRLEKERRSRPVDDDDPVLSSRRAASDVERDVTATEQQEMVWAAAATLGARDASVLDLHLRHGLGPAEIAEELGITGNNAHQLLFRLRKRLGAAIKAWVLVAKGGATCALLATELELAGVDGFGREAVGVVERHVESCEACQGRQASVLAPETLFASAPLLLMAPDVREAIVGAIRGGGVPLGPDATTPTPAEIEPPDLDVELAADSSPSDAESSPSDTEPSSSGVESSPSDPGPRDETDTTEATDATEATEVGAEPPDGRITPTTVPEATLGVADLVDHAVPGVDGEDDTAPGVLPAPAPDHDVDVIAGPVADDEEDDEPRRGRAALLLLGALSVLLVGLGIWLIAGGGDGADPAEGDLATAGSTEPRSGTTTTGDLASPSTTGPASTTETTRSTTTTATTTTAEGTTTTVTLTTVPQATTVTVRPTLVITLPPPTTTSTPPTTTTAPLPPTIDSFLAVPAGAPDGPCPPGQWATTLTWTTTRATSVEITATGVPTASDLAPDGNRVMCRPGFGPPPGGWHLTATGPGGTDTATA